MDLRDVRFLQHPNSSNTNSDSGCWELTSQMLNTTHQQNTLLQSSKSRSASPQDSPSVKRSSGKKEAEEGGASYKYLTWREKDRRRRFREEWKHLWLVVPYGSYEVMCLICHKIMTQRKLDTIKRHTIRRHSELLSMSDEERQRLYQQLNAASQHSSSQDPGGDELPLKIRADYIKRKQPRHAFGAFIPHFYAPKFPSLPQTRNSSKTNPSTAMALEKLLRQGKLFPGLAVPPIIPPPNTPVPLGANPFHVPIGWRCVAPNSNAHLPIKSSSNFHPHPCIKLSTSAEPLDMSMAARRPSAADGSSLTERLRQLVSTWDRTATPSAIGAISHHAQQVPPSQSSWRNF